MLHFNKIKFLVLRIFFITLFNTCLVVTASSEVLNVDNNELQLLISKGTPVVDIREKFEWKETGILLESHLITFFDSEGKYDAEKWLAELKMIVGPDDPIIIICRSGRRSLIVAEYLSSKKNFRKVYNVEAGINGWKRANLGTKAFK